MTGGGYRVLASANFGELVIFCINADFFVQIRIFQHFSRSTRFANLCTALNSKICRFRQILSVCSNFCYTLQMLLKITVFQADFDEIWSEFCENFTEIQQILKILDGSFSAVSNPIFATKYAFFSIFRDLQNEVRQFEKSANFCKIPKFSAKK